MEAVLSGRRIGKANSPSNVLKYSLFTLICVIIRETLCLNTVMKRIAMQERYFPIGIQSFEKIRQTNAIYVDKMSKNIGEVQ